MSEQETTQDVDKLLLLSEGINEMVDVGEDVMLDGKIDLGDIQYLGDMAKAGQKVISAVSEYKEMYGEAMDIDPAEAVQIVQALLAKK